MASCLVRPLIIISTCLFLVACAGSGKALKKAGLDEKLNLPAEFDTAGKGELYPGRWWEVFRSPELNALMDRMIENNLQIAQSYEGLKALRSTLGITSADKLPTVNAGAEAAEVYSTDSKGKRAWRDNYEISLTASYEVDLWGRIKAGVESDILEILSGRFSLEAMYMTLSAELADRFFIYKGLAQTLKLQKEQLEIMQKQISALEMMYSSGIGSLDTVYVKQTAIANLMEDMTEIRQSMLNAKRQIALLIGEADASDIEISDNYDFNIPYLPEAIPSAVADQRPDIQSAYAAVLKIDRDKAQAMADRYPKLSFTAGASYSGDDIARLVTPENFVTNLVGNLVMPLFDGGRLKLQAERQEYLLAAEIYSYYQTVLTALNEVSAALTDNVQNEQALALSTEKVKIEEKRLSIAEMRYEMGIKDYSDVLDNKISLLTGWIAEINARRLLISSRVELARAAGGSWAKDIVDGRLADAAGSQERN